MNMIPLLRAANAQIEAYLAHHAGGVAEELAGSLQPDEVFELQRLLDQIAPRLKEISQQKDDGTQAELLRYLHNLEQLRPVLLAAQEGLTVRRNALREKRTHVQRAQAWANSYKEML